MRVCIQFFKANSSGLALLVSCHTGQTTGCALLRVLTRSEESQDVLSCHKYNALIAVNLLGSHLWSLQSSEVELRSSHDSRFRIHAFSWN
uniref:Uncharacterized protein n=1 Tax=Ixodes ricinus TaxID=34613 RepID=A0A6B0U0Q7_IXORI